MSDQEQKAAEAAAREKIEEGLRELAAAYYGPSFVVTDWIFAVNTVDMAGDGTTTRYMLPTSDMPSHIAKGLLHQALDSINENALMNRLEQEDRLG